MLVAVSIVVSETIALMIIALAIIIDQQRGHFTESRSRYLIKQSINQQYTTRSTKSRSVLFGTHCSRLHSLHTRSRIQTHTVTRTYTHTHVYTHIHTLSTAVWKSLCDVTYCRCHVIHICAIKMHLKLKFVSMLCVRTSASFARHEYSAIEKHRDFSCATVLLGQKYTVIEKSENFLSCTVTGNDKSLIL